jgi:hypothetical protein
MKETIKEVKEGSVWGTSEGKKFRVLHIVENETETWVHYRNEPLGLIQEPIREYSCYIESFKSRFTPIPE